MDALTSLLSPSDVETVRQALNAAANGPFFPNWEFETLIGDDREAVLAVALAWPEIGDDRDAVAAIIVNAMNNLVGYPHGHDADLQRVVPGGREAVAATLGRLIGAGF